MPRLDDVLASGLERAKKVADALGASAADAAGAGADRRVPVPEGSLIVPGPPPSAAGEEESRDVWGFADTRFEVNPHGHVELTGTRYALSGYALPKLLPFMEGVLGVSLDPRDRHEPNYPPAVPEPRPANAFMRAVAAFLEPDQLSQEPLERLRHGHGHTQEEMYAIKHGGLARVPDLVVWPTEEDQVAALVQAALRHDVCLVPYGGGTNVTDALKVPEGEERFVVSVDMRRLNRILWIDPANRMACVQAGAVGRHLTAQLAEHGFTVGHEPDSVEFSTLGGWIATHASGMKKNRYGNIEDIVLDVSVVTPQGRLERSNVAPRESVGTDVRRWIFGSEGNFGIVTSAVVKLFPLPEAQHYGSVIFPDFEHGVSFMYELTQKRTPPASVRLVDNLQFKLSMALKPETTGWAARKSALEKLVVTKFKGFDPDQMVACTLVFEGDADEVEAQQKRVYAIAERHGGLAAGGANGQRGYQLTFGIAYIRDFCMNHWILAESFETSVPWSQAVGLIESVKARIDHAHAERGLPGKPFVTARISQVYDTGVCIYFYFAYFYKGVEHPSETYAEVEREARKAVLEAGGSLSHHHGVGKLRKQFLSDVMSPATLRWAQATKQAVDPSNVFGTANQLVADDLGDLDELPRPVRLREA